MAKGGKDTKKMGREVVSSRNGYIGEGSRCKRQTAKQTPESANQFQDIENLLQEGKEAIDWSHRGGEKARKKILALQKSASQHQRWID